MLAAANVGCKLNAATEYTAILGTVFIEAMNMCRWLDSGKCDELAGG
jgi:hypothetical protein